MDEPFILENINHLLSDRGYILQSVVESGDYDADLATSERLFNEVCGTATQFKLAEGRLDGLIKHDASFKYRMLGIHLPPFSDDMTKVIHATLHKAKGRRPLGYLKLAFDQR